MKRIRRQRTKGWRMPKGAVYVGRPSRWGNPFRVERGRPLETARLRRRCAENFAGWIAAPNTYWTGEESRRVRQAMLDSLPALRGKDLVCWCPLDQPCHADVLLELANA